MQKSVEWVLLIFLLIAPSYTIWKRLNLKKSDGNPMGLGHRAISLIALLVMVPVISILALESVLPKDALVSLLGTIVGYTLSSLTKDSN
jgi:hypothetical protein